MRAGREETDKPGGWKKMRKEQIRKKRKEQRRKKKERSTIANKIGTTVSIVFISYQTPTMRFNSP